MQVAGPFNALLREGLRSDFQDEVDTYEPQYPKFLKVSPWDSVEIKGAIIAGFSRFVERKDGDPFILESIKMSNVFAAVMREFGLGFNVTRNAIDFDKYKKLGPAAAKWLAYAYNLTKEYRSAEFLDDFFTGSTFVTWDGLAVGHATHTLVNSTTTQSNILSDAAQLGYGSVVAMRDLAYHLKNHQGDPELCDPKKLIIANSASNEFKAKQIFGSASEPFTADNQDNAINKVIGMPEIVRSVYASETYPRRWWMVDDKKNDAEFRMVRDLMFNDDFDTKTDTAFYTAQCAFIIWIGSYFGWFGSNAT